jgi:hypothetical protein
LLLLKQKKTTKKKKKNFLSRNLKISFLLYSLFLNLTIFVLLNFKEFMNLSLALLLSLSLSHTYTHFYVLHV